MSLPSDPAPLGFGRCGGTQDGLCPYYKGGGVQICYPCALREITRPPANSCPVCSQRLGFADETCRNWLCVHDRERQFRQVHAIGLKRGTLEDVLLRFKEAWGWAPVLARILVGWLNEHRDALPEYGLITGMPHAAGEHGRDYTPIQMILRLAHDEDPTYPFDYADPRVVTKSRETPSMRDLRLMQRRRVAKTEIYPTLDLTDRAAVRGQDALIVDDFFTTGFTANQVARKLREGGATAVDVLVFGRSLWW